MAWFGPAIRAVLPYLGSIVAASLPAFTTRKSEGAADAQAKLLKQQITELQSAASQNAEHIRELAGQVQKTVAALEQEAAAAEKAHKRAVALSIGAIVLSCAALGISLVVLFGR